MKVIVVCDDGTQVMAVEDVENLDISHGGTGNERQKLLGMVMRAVTEARLHDASEIARHRCGRCGDTFHKLSTEGPYKGMLCEDCALAKKHEEETERS